jgi:hypothetical protein
MELSVPSLYCDVSSWELMCHPLLWTGDLQYIDLRGTVGPDIRGAPMCVVASVAGVCCVGTARSAVGLHRFTV